MYLGSRTESKQEYEAGVAAPRQQVETTKHTGVKAPFPIHGNKMTEPHTGVVIGTRKTTYRSNMKEHTCMY
jgi:hypothetical protein